MGAVGACLRQVATVTRIALTAVETAKADRKVIGPSGELVPRNKSRKRDEHEKPDAQGHIAFLQPVAVLHGIGEGDALVCRVLPRAPTTWNETTTCVTALGWKFFVVSTFSGW